MFKRHYHASKCPGCCKACLSLRNDLDNSASLKQPSLPSHSELHSLHHCHQLEETQKKYTLQLQTTIEELRENLRESISKFHVDIDRASHVERALSSVAETLGHNLAISVKSNFDNQPDCFHMEPPSTDDSSRQRNSILDYSHSEWVAENCPPDFQEFLVILFRSAYKDLYPTRKALDDVVLTKFIAFTTATLFDKLDPTRFQWPPAVGVMVTLSSVLHSTLLQTVLSKFLPGGIGSAVSLSAKLKTLAASTKPLQLPTQNDIIHGYDNQSPEYQPKSYSKFELVNGTVVCIRLVIVCQTTAQMDPLNAPSNWKAFTECDRNVLAKCKNVN